MAEMGCPEICHFLQPIDAPVNIPSLVYRFLPAYIEFFSRCAIKGWCVQKGLKGVVSAITNHTFIPPPPLQELVDQLVKSPTHTV